MQPRQLFQKFSSKIRQDGPASALQSAARFASSSFKDAAGLNDPVDKRRKKIAVEINRLFDSTVRYGLFRGLKLVDSASWGSADRAGMLLGLYEQEVQNSLATVPPGYNTFIDLGAGDGYFAVGVLVSGKFEKTYCFEMTPRGREVIARNAELNGVGGRIEIAGEAAGDFYKRLPQSAIDRSVLFVDIEGGEFELLDDAAFEAFRRSIIFVELHDWFFDDGADRLQKLRGAAVRTHSVRELRMTSRDLSVFPELDCFSDTDRWLICSEGRPRAMTWLRFDPLAGA